MNVKWLRVSQLSISCACILLLVSGRGSGATKRKNEEVTKILEKKRAGLEEGGKNALLHEMKKNTNKTNLLTTQTKN